MSTTINRYNTNTVEIDPKTKFYQDAVKNLFYFAGYRERWDQGVEDRFSASPYHSIIAEHDYYDTYTISEKRLNKFAIWFREEYIRVFKVDRKTAENEFSWFYITYGLKEEE